jgi:hypothetical protein
MRKIPCFVLSFFAALAPIHGAFERAPRAARISALGGAGVALADNSASLFMNPAGLAPLRRPDVSFLWSKPDAGLGAADIQEGYAAVSYPFRTMSLGAGAAYFDGGGLVRELTGSIGVARRWSRWGAGVDVKYLHHRYGGDETDPAFADGRARGAPTVDLGVAGAPWKGFSVGAVVRNLTEPDLGLRAEDRVRREYQVGIGTTRGRLRLALDAILRARDSIPSAEEPLTWAAGIEYLLAPLTLRAGANGRDITAGLGVAHGPFRLDYAAVFGADRAAQSIGTHRLGLSMSWGPAKVTKPVKKRPGARR